MAWGCLLATGRHSFLSVFVIYESL
jgi:hypothetical protein